MADTTINVTSTSDSGAGTLRQAITDLNAIVGSHTITFTGLTGTITLASALPTLTKSMTITGPGLSSLTISGNSLYRVFDLTAGLTFSISALTIANGKATAAGLYNNMGGGIRNGTNSGGADLTISNCYFTGCNATIGGAIHSYGNLTVTNTSFVSNTGTTASCISSFSGSVTIGNCTFSGNTGTPYYTNSSFTATVYNCTFSGNSGSIGSISLNKSGSASVLSSTISGNASGSGNYTGAVYLGEYCSLTLKNTIISGNTGTADFNSYNSNRSISSAATNIIGTISSASATSAARVIGDPLLGALQNNGGTTQTMAVGAGSVAINAGTAAATNVAPVSALDQRGTARSATTPTIGAVEYVAVTTTTTTAAPTTTTTTTTASPTTTTTTTTVAPVIIKIKRSSTSTVVPATLSLGELGINIVDKKIWVGNSSQTPILISDYNNLGNQGFQGSQGNQGVQGNQGAAGTNGSQGFQGLTGTGNQGLQGNQGVVGTAGSQGSQGFQGVVGTTGNQGSQGFQGVVGTTGNQGLQGSQGTVGTTGSQGNQGLQGFQGVVGTTGNQGSQGTAGTNGSQGFQGVVGTTGSQGSQGFQGATGIGNQGFQGSTGTGNQGNQGFQGVTGTGNQGSQGNQGFQGATGTGNQGSQGSQGATGTGSQGSQGNQGFQGVTGTGNQGSQGSQGATGTGSQGSQGNQGFQGVTGTGNQGSQGSQGATGTGSQGSQGNQGLTGPVAGSANQVVYKDGSNAAAGSSSFTFDGTTVTVPILSVTRTAGTGTQSPSVTVTAPAHTALTASTESSDLNINLARTAQFATGALTTQRAVRIQAPTYSFVGASTLTTASTVQIDSAPVAGTNATITNAYALRVLTGVAAGVGIVIQGATSQTGALLRVQDNSGTASFTVAGSGATTITMPAPSGTGGQGPTLLTVTGTAFSQLAASEVTDVYFDLNRAVSFVANPISTQRAIRITSPSYQFASPSTITTAVTMQIDSAPLASTNATITNAYALRVLTGTATAVGIVIQGATSQTGDLFRVQNSTPANLFTINNNGSLVLSPYGTSAGQTNEIRFLELAANGTNYVGFKASDSIASNVIWTLPAADGTAGQVLSTNASGVLSWSSAGSGTVTSIATTSPITGGTITGTGTIGINAASANTASYVVQRDASGDFSAGKITLGGSGSSTSAQLTFSGSTNNWIDLGTNGYAAPAFTTRSVGTKVVFYKDLGASSTDYAAGIEMNALWFSIPAATSDRAFKFYGGTTNVASLTGDGNFSANKKITGETLSSTVAIGTAPITVTSTTQVTNLNASLLEGYSTATANTVSTIVRRDASGNFSAGTITAALTGNASTATSLSGGGAGQLPYNTGSGATSFLAAGTAGQVLQSNATSAPSWSSRVNYTAGTSAPASPIAGDHWYDTTTGIIYTYVNDGTSSQWVQGSTATLATGVPAGGTTNQFLVKSSATDYATAWTGTLTNPTFTNYTETLYDAGTGSAFTINLSNGTIQKFTTNANMTLTLPASTAGKSFVIMVVYGAANALTWSSPSTLKWVGGTTPTATSVTGKIDIFSFFQDGTNTYGTVYGQNF